MCLDTLGPQTEHPRHSRGRGGGGGQDERGGRERREGEGGTGTGAKHSILMFTRSRVDACTRHFSEGNDA